MMNLTKQIQGLACFLCVITSIFIPAFSIQGRTTPWKLALQWPTSFCNSLLTKQCRGPVPENFTIHGLWPSDSHEPSEILTVDEVKKALEGVEFELSKQWPCFKGRKYEFWTHEWNKHGRFSGKSPIEYFRLTLHLKQQVDLLNSSFYPFNYHFDNQNVETERIGEAIEAGTGYLPAIRCNKDRRGVNQLLEVRFCIDHRSISFIGCQKFIRTGCKPKIRLSSPDTIQLTWASFGIGVVRSSFDILTETKLQYIVLPLFGSFFWYYSKHLKQKIKLL